MGGRNGGGGGGGGIVVGDANMAEGGEFECLAVLQGHDGNAKCVAFGPSHSQFGNGQEVIYSASYGDTIRVWIEDDDEWYCVMTLDMPVHSLTVMCLGLSPGGVRMYSGSMDGIIAILRMNRYNKLQRKRLAGRTGGRWDDEDDNVRGVGAKTAAVESWDCVGRLVDAHSGYAVMLINCAPSRAGHGGVTSCGGDDAMHVYCKVVATTAVVTSSSSTLDQSPKFELDSTAECAHNGNVRARGGKRLHTCRRRIKSTNMYK